MASPERYDLLVNHAPDGDTMDWVSSLVADLSNLLARKLKRGCQIKAFSCPDSPTLSADVTELLNQAELMVVVVSESYTAQNQQELAAFAQAHEDDPRLRSRFFLLECGSTPRGQLHWQLADRRGYRFWIRDPENKSESRALQNNDPADTERFYARELDRLAEDLAKTLKLLEASPPPRVDVREEGFDVFLCHNSEDKADVRRVGEALKARGLRPWLDEWELPVGQPWIRRLEEQIETVHSAAVFLGPNGLGPWQQREIEAILQELDRNRRPIIPVIMGEPETIPKLPLFLRGINWVRFWHDDPISLDQLVSGITGKKQLPAVYLAETTDDLFRLRIAVAQHLRQYELRVLPDDFLYPEAPERFEAAVERDLAQCRLFVQLLGSQREPSQSGFPPNFVKKQFDLAVAQEMTILQWRSPSLDLTQVDDDNHLALLKGDYVREVTIDEFKRHVRKEAKTPPLRRGRQAFVHFAPDSADENLLDQVLGELKRNDIGYEPTELEHLKTLVKGGKHTLVFYSDEELRRQLRVGLKECKPLIANRSTVLGVYAGPPPEIPKLRVNYDGLIAIDGQQGLNKEGLEDFIKAVKDRVASA